MYEIKTKTKILCQDETLQEKMVNEKLAKQSLGRHFIKHFTRNSPTLISLMRIYSHYQMQFDMFRNT